MVVFAKTISLGFAHCGYYSCLTTLCSSDTSSSALLEIPILSLEPSSYRIQKGIYCESDDAMIDVASHTIAYLSFIS
jgi:hypothetical protein